MRKLRLYFLTRKSPASVVEEYMAAFRAAFGGEHGTTLAAAMLAKKTLDTTRQVDLPFPEPYFDGALPVDDAARAMLTAYARALQKFQHDLEDAEVSIGMAVVRGMPTWIASCFILADPALLPYGKEIWAALADNAAGVEQAHKFLTRREPSEVERTYFNYRPAVFS